jgi:aspartyl protease family protein
VRIDGERRVLRAGETSPEGVRLVQADTQRAEIEIDGRREVLPLGVVVAPMTASPAAAEVTLYKGPGGFFFANGAINGRTVKFLVDTGANTVALNSATARRLGIDYLKQGRVGVASTAGGMVKMYQVVLPRVSVGQISLSNVAAGVIEGPHPDVPLLGMSFLGKLEMKRDGRRMDLVQKY